MKDNSQLLASLAVFRELYNSEKDIYGVIASFLNDIIVRNKLYSFNLNLINDKFLNTFEFNIPRAVIKTALGRLKYLERRNNEYFVKDITQINSYDFDEKQNEIIKQNNEIIENLYEYVKSKTNKKLSSLEKLQILHNFCNFLIDESNGSDYTEYITAFIIENKNDEKFKERLKLIREGVILYSGIKYNNNLNDFGSWKTELSIYFETEILFHLAGYDGEIFKILVLELLDLIKEINNKAKKRLIKLKYFAETKNEIEDFFKKAIYLLEGKEKINSDATAMKAILNGCSNPSDIIEKKSDFYLLLNKHNINLDTYDKYFEEYNHEYNIVNSDIIDRISQEINKDATPYLRLLNFISIHRKEANINNFENIGHILLSGNSITLKAAWNDLVKEEGNVPLATHLSFLTNKFWFKLNKGFGKNSLPKSFDVITKAQISLSKILNYTVGEKYSELQKEYEQGNITEEQAKARIVNLREQVRKPEEIKEDDINDVLSVITEDSLDKFIEEQEHFKIKAEKTEQKVVQLQNDLSEKEDFIIKSKEEKKLLNQNLIKTKEELLEEKENGIKILENQKQPIDEIINKKYFISKLSLIVVILLIYGGTIFLIWKFGWNILEQWTWILFVIIPTVFSLIYLVLYEKTINPINFLLKRKNKIIEKTYTKFNFDYTLLEKLNEEKQKLINDIETLKSQLPTTAISNAGESDKIENNEQK